MGRDGVALCQIFFLGKLRIYLHVLHFYHVGDEVWDVIALAQYEDDLQMMAVGAEWDLWQWAQLRAGYRHDLKDNLDDALSAGLGISPGDLFHLDLAGTYAGNNQFGGVVQTSFTF